VPTGTRAIGLATGSLDIGPSEDIPAYRDWLASGRFGIECLTHLDRVPPAGAVVVSARPRSKAAAAARRACSRSSPRNIPLLRRYRRAAADRG
jgi:kynurenine formamidase